MHHPISFLMRLRDQAAPLVGTARARRAGLGKAEPGVGSAGRGAAGAALIYIWRNSAVQRGTGAVCCAVCRAVLGLPGWFSVITASPRPLAVPFADSRGPPDWLPADPPVGAGHLATGDIGADGGRRDAQEARDVACCPPVSGERLCHAAQITALTLLDRG
jgi:hypothetical protein